MCAAKRAQRKFVCGCDAILCRPWRSAKTRVWCHKQVRRNASSIFLLQRLSIRSMLLLHKGTSQAKQPTKVRWCCWKCLTETSIVLPHNRRSVDLCGSQPPSGLYLTPDVAQKELKIGACRNLSNLDSKVPTRLLWASC